MPTQVGQDTSLTQVRCLKAPEKKNIALSLTTKNGNINDYLEAFTILEEEIHIYVHKFRKLGLQITKTMLDFKSYFMWLRQNINS